MVNYDGFAHGIEFGGLRNILDIKILVCYILNSVKIPMARNQICDTLQKNGLANYFDINSALDELLENKAIKESEVAGESLISITPKGSNSAKELENHLLHGMRETAVKTALNIIARARSEKENNVNVKKVDNGYDVTFEIESNGDRLLSLTLNVADEWQAEQLKDGFLDDPGALYSDIINRLIGE